MPKFITFSKFVGTQYDNLSSTMKRIYKGESNFYKNYVGNNGFTDWLKSIEGIELTFNQAKSVVATYIIDGSRKVQDLPHLFHSLERTYNITLPVIEGIATVEYWDKLIVKK